MISMDIRITTAFFLARAPYSPIEKRMAESIR